MPDRFPALDRHRSFGIRRCIHGSYLIFYCIGDDTVDIMHILHGATDYEKLLFSDDRASDEDAP